MLVRRWNMSTVRPGKDLPAPPVGSSWLGSSYINDFPNAGRLQRVAQSGEEIADSDGRIIAKEDRARGRDERDDGVFVSDNERKMLGGEGVDEGDAVLERLDQHHPGTVLEGFFQLGLTAQGLDLLFDLGFDRVEQLFGISDESHDAVAAVFGLGEHVGGDVGGIAARVGEGHDLARSGQEIDGDDAEELPFRLDDEGIAGTVDFQHRPDRFRAVGHRREPLGSADRVDLGGGGILKDVEQGRIDNPAGTGRRHHDDLGTSRCGGETDGHVRGRDERGTAARHVDADALEGQVTLADEGALGVLAGPVLAQAALREVGDVFSRGGDGLLRRLVDRGIGGGEFGGGDAELLRVGKAGLVEAIREIDEGGVAFFADFVEDTLHDGLDPGRRSIAAVELLQGRSEVLLVVAEDAHGGKSRRSGKSYSTTIRSVFK